MPGINDLPAETLGMIFLEIFEPCGKRDFTPRSTPFFSPECPVDPFYLGQVCRWWRGVTFLTKKLWSHITIVHPKPIHLARAKMWVERAGKYPLAVIISQSKDPSEEEYNTTESLFTDVFCHPELWLKFGVSINGRIPRGFLPSLEKIAKAEIPRLEEACVVLGSRLNGSQHEKGEELRIKEIWNVLQDIPSLIGLLWHAPYASGTNLSHSIKNLDLESFISVDAFLHQFCSAVNLQNFIIRDLSKRSSRTIMPERALLPENAPHIVFPHLFALKIKTELDIRQSLQRLVLPSLRYLSLAGSGLRNYNYRDIVALFCRSQCKISAFYLQCRGLTEDEVIEWMNMPQLCDIHSLSLLAVNITDSLLLALHRPARHGSQACYFKKLKHLVIGTYSPHIDAGNLLQMLESRFWTVPSVSGQDLPETELESAIIIVKSKTSEMKVYQDELIERVKSTTGSSKILAFIVPSRHV
ncbi:hypothetical protein B0H34DRAFT_195939 [Crassisporium funariophilum]|nr:hypothetical protein B0H34DRAFT_195939 [Crassisporium funariophilum]